MHNYAWCSNIVEDWKKPFFPERFFGKRTLYTKNYISRKISLHNVCVRPSAWILFEVGAQTTAPIVTQTWSTGTVDCAKLHLPAWVVSTPSRTIPGTTRARARARSTVTTTSRAIVDACADGDIEDDVGDADPQTQPHTRRFIFLPLFPQRSGKSSIFPRNAGERWCFKTEVQ